MTVGIDEAGDDRAAQDLRAISRRVCPRKCACTAGRTGRENASPSRACRRASAGWAWASANWGDAPVYGSNTGFGKLASTRISRADLATLQCNLIRSHCVDVGAPLQPGVVRLMLAIKTASLARGHSGLRESLVKRAEPVALAAGQGIEFLRPLKSSAPLVAVHALLREVCPPTPTDHDLAPDIERATELASSGKLTAWVQQTGLVVLQ